MENETYQKPVLEVIDFAVRDVITTSGEVVVDPGWEGDHNMGLD